MHLFSTKPRSSYLQSGRLADVLSLLQTLALHPYQTHRNESQLQRELCGKPRSCASWTKVAELHPEFFRVSSQLNAPSLLPVLDDDYVDDDPDYPVSLIARHQGKRSLKIGSPPVLKIPPIDTQLLKALMELAVDLHDQEEKRHNKWFPLAGQVMSALGAFIGATIALLFKTRP